MTWPSASDQIAAVLAAPIPFFLTIFVMGVAMWGIIWRAMEWRYRGIIELRETMHSQAAAESQIIKSRLADSEASLDASEKKLARLAKQNPLLAERRPNGGVRRNTTNPIGFRPPWGDADTKSQPSISA